MTDSKWLAPSFAFAAAIVKRIDGRNCTQKSLYGRSSCNIRYICRRTAHTARAFGSGVLYALFAVFASPFRRTLFWKTRPGPARRGVFSCLPVGRKTVKNKNHG